MSKRQEEDRLHHVLLATRDAVYDWDIGAGEIWRDETHPLGGPPVRLAESGPNLWAANIHPDDRPRAIIRLEQVFREKECHWTAEYRSRRLDGSYATVWDRGHIVYDPRGTPARLVGTLTDVTAREQVLDDLRLSEARYRALVHAASQAVWVYNTSADAHGEDAGALWWEEVTGQPPTEAVGGGWLEMLHPEDCERVREQWTRCRIDGTPYDAEYRVCAREGGYRQFHVRGIPIRCPDGSIREWVGMFTDVTERRLAEQALLRSEERFRAFMDNSPAAASIVDLQGRVQYVSKAFQRMFRLPSVEPVGRTIFDLFSPAIAQSWLEAGREAARAGEALEAIEPGVRADGTEGVFLTYRFPVSDSGDGCLVGGVAADITELRRLEDQLRQVHKMEAVGQLAGGVAHDFNNVLTVIQGFSELVLQELPADHELAQSVGEIKKASERAAELTRQLLAFSRRSVIRPVVLDLNVVVAEAQNMLRRLIAEDVELKVVLDPALWRIEADPVQIDQILLNLAANARDAMSHGGCLTVETRNVTVDRAHTVEGSSVPPGNYVRLSVSDTGCGLDPATRDRIFEPFFTTKEPGRGTGMGLAAVYGIVQQFGAYIEVDSEPGVQTTFLIYLPPRLEAVADRQDVAELPAAPGGRETLILVEDDDPVRALSCEVLTRHGYVVLEARDGPDALRVSQEHAGVIDLLVSDVVMPHMSGLQVAERLRQARPHIKTLFVSGYPDDALGAHGVLDAKIAFLQKPFVPATLARAVRGVLDSGQTRNAED